MRAVLAALVLCAGCGESRYTITFEPPAGDALEGAAGIELSVLRQDCSAIAPGAAPEHDWIVRRSDDSLARVAWHVGEAPADIGVLDPGRYWMLARVREASCVVRWAGCSGVKLERGNGGDIRVMLAAAVESPACGPAQECDGQGVCSRTEQECDGVTVACDLDGDGQPACLPEEVHSCDCNDGDGEVCSAPECKVPTCVDGACSAENAEGGTPCGPDDTGTCEDGACSAACEPGDTDTRPCGACMSEARTCEGGVWSEWGDCAAGGVCDEGDERVAVCGNCGERSETCTAECAWDDSGPCLDEGECAPEATRIIDCGTCGTEEQTCSAVCAWDPGVCDGTPGRADVCEASETCCEDGSCGACCGADTSTCGVEALCMDWTCDAGACTAVDEAPGTDPELECAPDCCVGAGACGAC